jgi:hypothetical protein
MFRVTATANPISALVGPKNASRCNQLLFLLALGVHDRVGRALLGIALGDRRPGSPELSRRGVVTKPSITHAKTSEDQAYAQ